MRREELAITSVLLVIIIVVVGYISAQFGDTTFGLYNTRDFWENVLVEAHGMILDLLFVGVLLIMILNRIEKKKELIALHEKIDFNRNLKSEEAKQTIFSVIGMFNKKKITSFDLHQCDLSGLIMSTVNLSGSSIHAVNFRKTNLKSSVLTKTNGERTLYDSANLNSVDFSHSRLYRVELNNVKARSCKFFNCKIIRAQFNGADLNNADFRQSSINNSSFENADLKNVDFRKCEFGEKINFSGADLQSSNFSGARHLPFTEIIKAKSLKKAKFDDADLARLKSMNANLDL